MNLRLVEKLSTAAYTALSLVGPASYPGYLQDKWGRVSKGYYLYVGNTYNLYGSILSYILSLV